MSASVSRGLSGRLVGRLREITNPEHYSISRFTREAAASLPAGRRVLDAGAGGMPYRRFFDHVEYESTDFAQGDGLTFVCDLTSIPRPDEYYDAIICTQVLEHVEFPLAVLVEFRRVLKGDGRLFLTVPQSWGVHLAPHHYFNFTIYGLRSLFSQAGLQEIDIQARGGIFWLLANMIHLLPDYLRRPVREKGVWRLIADALRILSWPLTRVIVPVALFHLDWLDKRRDWTLGYACIARKPLQPGTA